MIKKKKIIVLLLISYASVSPAALLCRDIFDLEPKNKTSIKKVEAPELLFDTSTKKLRSTLSGKLATVWRSEWKTKLSVVESNQYVYEMVNKSLTLETRQLLLKDLDVRNEGFTRQVHERMSELQEQNKLQLADDLAVRDKPAPKGAKDTTFTYYTKAITTAKGEGKHQLRIRTYLRKISYLDIPLHQEVKGYDSDGHIVTISKVAESAYKIQIGTEIMTQSEKVLSLTQMISQYGNSFQLYAPHGKSFKLEVKTALKDKISNTKYPLLAGQHMVQKLDVSLTPTQVELLFAPFESLTTVKKQKELLRRVDQISSDLMDKMPENKDRIEAVFSIIKNGILMEADFLSIEGATVYHRTAFESKSGFQTTIDRDQGVYIGQMYGSLGLQNPIEILKNNSLLSSQEKEARHVELKIPVTAIDKTVGIEFHDPQSAPQAQVSERQTQLDEAVKVFYGFVKNADHSGKFNYIQKNSDD